MLAAHPGKTPRELLAAEAARVRRVFRFFPVAAALLVGGVAPALFYVHERSTAEAEVAGLAQHSGRELSKLVTMHPDTWLFMGERIVEILDRRPASAIIVRQEVTTSGGQPIASSGQPCRGLCVQGASEVVDGEEPVGRVLVEGTLRGSWASFAIVLLLGAVLAAAAYWSLKRLPLRVINRALGQIDDLTLALHESVNNLEREVAKRTEELKQANRQLRGEIEERKLVEVALNQAKDEAEKASRVKSEFLAQTSHELRTPLNAIIGFSEIMRLEMFGPIGNQTYSGYINDIYTAGQNLLELLKDILDISRIEAGGVELEETSISVARLLQFCETLFQKKASDGAIALVFEAPPDLPPLFGDERRIRQVLLNLVSNAVKFTPPGGQVAVRAFVSENGYVFEVADTGIGIAADEMATVLMPFGRSSESAKRGIDGVGLGLSLAQRLVERHGGTLRLASVLGTGTTVTIVFPPTRIASLPSQEDWIAATST